MLRFRAAICALCAGVALSHAAPAAAKPNPGKPAPAKPDKPSALPATSQDGEPSVVAESPSAATPAATPKPATLPKPTVAQTPIASKPVAIKPVATKPSASKPGAAAKKPHHVGRAPRRPGVALPPGAARAAPNEAARRKVTGSPAPNGVKDDPELNALRDAERVLFPKPLPGSSAGWSWELPRAAEKSGTEVVASGLPPSIQSDPGLDDDPTATSDAEWIRSLTLPDLPVRLESRVVRYLKFYRDNPRGRAIARVWVKKSGRYASSLKAELTRAGLPGDLVWLSLIESGHNATIVSPAGATGLWQFMPDAARLYGLTVDRWVDERLDPKRATDAAILYLGDLHRRFGNWELAMAAYNMGYGGLSKAIRKFNTNDFWELSRYEAGIPWETTLYVPKIFAIAIVMTNKKAFGLDDLPLDPAETFDAVSVASGVSLEQVAQAADVPTATLEALNPHYLAGRAPPARPGTKAGGHRVNVPPGKAVQIGARLAKAGDADTSLEPYVVRLGESLGAVARARGTDERTLGRVNRVRDDETLGAGTVLLVPRRAGPPEPAKTEDVVVVSPREYRYPDRERVFYRVQSGDSPGRIAQAFSITRTELEAWNSLDPSARLQAGMVLQAWVRPGTDLGGVQALREGQVRVLTAGSPEFFDYHEGLNGRRRVTVEAKSGDTLASIGRRYGMSIGWMERINRRSRKKELRSGDKLVVYVAANAPVARVASTASATAKAAPLPEIAPPEPEALPAGVEEPAIETTEPTAAEGEPPAAGG